MAKAKPSKELSRRHTTVGVIAIIAWFLLDLFIPQKIDIFYGSYGALLFGALTAFVAHAKGRNPLTWFAIGLWTVLLGLIIALILPKLYDRLCPYCLEGAAKGATVCPHCRKEIEAKEIEEIIPLPDGLPEKMGRTVWKSFFWGLIVSLSLISSALIMAAILRVMGKV